MKNTELLPLDLDSETARELYATILKETIRQYMQAIGQEELDAMIQYGELPFTPMCQITDGEVYQYLSQVSVESLLVKLNPAATNLWPEEQQVGRNAILLKKLMTEVEKRRTDPVYKAQGLNLSASDNFEKAQRQATGALGMSSARRYDPLNFENAQNTWVADMLERLRHGTKEDADKLADVIVENGKVIKDRSNQFQGIPFPVEFSAFGIRVPQEEPTQESENEKNEADYLDIFDANMESFGFHGDDGEQLIIHKTIRRLFEFMNVTFSSADHGAAYEVLNKLFNMDEKQTFMNFFFHQPIKVQAGILAVYLVAPSLLAELDTVEDECEEETYSPDAG